MPLASASILAGATVSATGGTAQTFSPDGVDVKKGVHLIDASVADFRTRPSLTAKSSQPSVLPDGSFSKDNRSLKYADPFIDSKGKIQYDTVEIIRRMHPESSAAKATGMLVKAAQFAVDADFTSFWAVGSLL